jgi:hypothetical protein
MSKNLSLGDLLALSRGSSSDLQHWLEAIDEGLAERVRREADIRGESIAQFVRIAVADFLAEADEEAWADLMSAARDAPDPGAACVIKMTAVRLQMAKVL